MGTEGVSLLIAGFGTLLAGLGFYVTSRRSSTSTYAHELEQTVKMRDATIVKLTEELTFARHDLVKAEARIDTLLDRLKKNHG